MRNVLSSCVGVSALAHDTPSGRAVEGGEPRPRGHRGSAAGGGGGGGGGGGAEAARGEGTRMRTKKLRFCDRGGVHLSEE